MGAEKAVTTYRCEACGNKTRFDVFDTVQRKRYEHAELGGAVSIEDEEIISRRIEKVVCRWCDRSDTVREVQDER